MRGVSGNRLVPGLSAGASETPLFRVSYTVSKAERETSSVFEAMLRPESQRPSGRLSSGGCVNPLLVLSIEAGDSNLSQPSSLLERASTGSARISRDSKAALCVFEVTPGYPTKHALVSRCLPFQHHSVSIGLGGSAARICAEKNKRVTYSSTSKQDGHQFWQL